MKLLLSIMTFLFIACYSQAEFKITNTQVKFINSSGKALKVVNLKPKKYFKNKYNDRCSVSDFCRKVSGGLLIYRGYTEIIGVCGTPVANRVELYDKLGKLVLEVDNPKGFWFGRIFESKTNKWFVIIGGGLTEGEVDRLLIVKSDNTYKECGLPSRQFVNCFKFDSGWGREKDVIWLIRRASEVDSPEEIIEISETEPLKITSVQFKELVF